MGRSALRVSPICVGMVGSAEVALTAFDAGINFFFVSADLHWSRYAALRDGLAQLLARRPSVRAHLVVAGVSYMTQPEFCWAPFDELIAAIPGLDHLDIHVAGGVYGREWSARSREYRAQLAESFLGVRAIGASFHDRAPLARVINSEAIDIAFARYNPFHTGMRDEVFPALVPSRTLLYNFKSTAAHVGASRCTELGLGPEYWRPHVVDSWTDEIVSEEPGAPGVGDEMDDPVHGNRRRRPHELQQDGDD
ncbi:MAG: hypothetical protein AAGC55_34170, partial [Myxococcota bacterium]